MTELPKYLYHYTNWNGLLGILDNQTLWATHYKFLNDYSEVTLFLEKILPKILGPHIYATYKTIFDRNPARKNLFEETGADFVSEVILHTEETIQNLWRPLREQIYLTSFCAEIDKKEDIKNINNDGLLSQWRAYGADGGFAIVFDTIELDKLLREEFKEFLYGYSHITKVFYSHEEEKFKKDKKAQLDKLVKFVSDEIVATEQKAPFVNNDGYGALFDCIAVYKHMGFSEENEIRIVLHLPPDELKASTNSAKGKKELKYRDRYEEKVPYIELFKGKTLPIKKVIVGPHHNQETRAAYLRTRLKNADMVSISSIPYINRSSSQ